MNCDSDGEEYNGVIGYGLFDKLDERYANCDSDGEEYDGVIGFGLFCMPCKVPLKEVLVYRTCKEKGCEEIPRYNLFGKTIGLFCEKHSQECMIIVKFQSRCAYEDCNKASYFNFKGKERIYCGAHRLPGMVDVKNPRCIEKDCERGVIFGKEGDPKPTYCGEHRKDGMIDLCHRRCKEKGCKIAAIFNFPDAGTGLYCGTHKKPGMIDPAKTKCQYKDCNITALFGIEGCEPKFCFTHKSDDMINIKSNRCIEEGCYVRPTFGIVGTRKGLYCEPHKKAGLVNVVSKMCEFDGCTTLATFGIRNESPTFCLKHKSDSMVNVRNKTCKTDLCDTLPLGYKYDGYCVFCYIHLFPDKPVSRNYKTKEKSIVDFVTEQFFGLKWICDKSVVGGISQKRPDILLDMKDFILIIEIDEDQHKKYEEICENKRIMEISQDLKFKNMVFVRFNPDKYIKKDKTKIKSCWDLNKLGILTVSTKKEWKERLDRLKTEVQFWMKNKPTKMITIIELFYDEV